MTITEINNSIKSAIASAAKDLFGIDELNIATEIPPKTELGDVAFPVAFELAKAIKQATGEKQNPRAIAEELSNRVSQLNLISRVEIAGPGYLNVYYDRGAFFAANLGIDPLPRLSGENGNAAAPKVCVEHTSVNPNKAAHIGHVRNSVLGDTFQRILSASGKRVEIQNYIDNTGVQVADVVVGFLYLEDRDLESIRQLDHDLQSRGVSFDYYCWDLYAKVGKEYEKNEDLRAKRAEVLHLIEEGGNDTAILADYVATRNVECILATMERLDIRYDLLPRESEILHLHFWDKAFEQMKQLGVIHFVDSGKQAGCWVMPFEDHDGNDEHETDKILVRSNGTVTYTGKDIAYQMWKLGILGLDFNYRRFHKYANGREVWMTTTDASESGDRPSFGGGETIYNVIDTRQSYTQGVVKKGVASISPDRGLQASVHLAYEMVALSPAAAEELGFVISDEDRDRTFIEMSGRKGLGVKADDLIDRLETNALAEVTSRHADISDDEKRAIAHDIAVGALRYFLLKFTRNTVIVFDFKEALSFEGETGCFCQYSAVRANSIFRKLADTGESLESVAATASSSKRIAEILADDANNDVWAILTNALRLDETIEQAANAAEPAIVAKYAFNLAKSFNLFYHNHKMVNEPDSDLRAILISVTATVHRSLTAALGVLGISVPAKM